MDPTVRARRLPMPAPRPRKPHRRRRRHYPDPQGSERTTVAAIDNDVSIVTSDLTKRFGDEVAVDSVSFEVPRGSIFGYIGLSGSGKTTTIRMLLGIYEPSDGSVHVLGENPRTFDRRTREKIGYMPQHFVLYPDLSVRANLSFAASIYGMGAHRGRRMNELLDLVELSEHRGKLARDISGGMQRRLICH